MTTNCKRRLRPQPIRFPTHRPRTGLVGGQLILAYREACRDLVTGDDGLDIVAEWASAGELKADRGALPRLDGLVAYVPTLDTQRIEDIQEICPDARLVVAFRYATAADLEDCRQSGRAILRWPAEWQTVVRRVTASMSADPTSPRRYSDEELVHISLMLPGPDVSVRATSPSSSARSTTTKPIRTAAEAATAPSIGTTLNWRSASVAPARTLRSH